MLGNQVTGQNNQQFNTMEVQRMNLPQQEGDEVKVHFDTPTQFISLLILYVLS